jgi:hypothetical protein
LEATDHTQAAAPHDAVRACAECLAAVSEPVLTLRGETLCGACAESYYVACAACGGLVARDEAAEKDGAAACVVCALKPAGVASEDAPAEAEVEQLVAEYVRLHAEEKRVKDRLEEIKGRLKLAALFRQRVANAVTLRGEDGAVKCSYRAAWKCDEEKVSALESALDAATFATLFERTVKFSPVRENIETLLSPDSGADAALRTLVASAVEQSEQATFTVVRPKKS